MSDAVPYVELRVSAAELSTLLAVTSIVRRELELDTHDPTMLHDLRALEPRLVQAVRHLEISLDGQS